MFKNTVQHAIDPYESLTCRMYVSTDKQMTEEKAQRNAAMLSQKMMEMTKLQKMLTHATKVGFLTFR